MQGVDLLAIGRMIQAALVVGVVIEIGVIVNMLRREF
jgi:hypothetical protein